MPYKGNAPDHERSDRQADRPLLRPDHQHHGADHVEAGQEPTPSPPRPGSKSLPDLPTADEAGLKGFEVGVWHGIYAPKGTPDAIIQKLSKTLQEALRDPDLVKRFNDINTEPVPQDQATPEALKAQLISEVDRWAPIIKAAGQFAD